MNKVCLVGRLAKDIEVRKTTSNLSVAAFTVACDRYIPKDKQADQTADFISCVAWRGAADFLGQYATKGCMVSVEGRIQTRSYDGQDGKKVYITEVLCENVHLLSRPQQTQTQGAQKESTYEPKETQSEMFPFDGKGSSLDIDTDALPFY